MLSSYFSFSLLETENRESLRLRLGKFYLTLSQETFYPLLLQVTTMLKILLPFSDKPPL